MYLNGMVAVTIATGKAYLKMAERAAESAREFTGLETHIITENPCPGKCSAWGKLKLLEMFDDSVLFFDADTVHVAPWDPAAIQEFAAVKDFPSGSKSKDCKHYRLDPSKYFNSGVIIMHQKNRPAMEMALAIGMSPNYRTNFRFEQTAINVAIQRTDTPIVLLSRRFNAMSARGVRGIPKDPVIVHATSRPGSARFRRFKHVMTHLGHTYDLEPKKTITIDPP